MKKELEDKLFKKYPKIFKQRKDPMTQTAMCWGISTDDGWYTIIDCLCDNMQYIIDEGIKTYHYYPFGRFIGGLFSNAKLVGRWKTEKVPQVEAIQVKEKFGGLRFYYTGGSERTSELIHFVESLSYRVCETCGSTKDVTQTTGWIYSICQECQDKAEKRGKI